SGSRSSSRRTSRTDRRGGPDREARNALARRPPALGSLVVTRHVTWASAQKQGGTHEGSQALHRRGRGRRTGGRRGRSRGGGGRRARGRRGVAGRVQGRDGTAGVQRRRPE